MRLYSICQRIWHHVQKTKSVVIICSLVLVQQMFRMKHSHLQAFWALATSATEMETNTSVRIKPLVICVLFLVSFQSSAELHGRDNVVSCGDFPWLLNVAHLGTNPNVLLMEIRIESQCKKCSKLENNDIKLFALFYKVYMCSF